MKDLRIIVRAIYIAALFICAACGYADTKLKTAEYTD